MKYRCPCCGFYTLKECPIGNYEICPVCFWEDDPCSYDDPDEECCSNGVSLNQAKSNYMEFGACKEELKMYVRNPFDDEKSGIDSFPMIGQ